jgi:hypothetical protein
MFACLAWLRIQRTRLDRIDATRIVLPATALSPGFKGTRRAAGDGSRDNIKIAHAVFAQVVMVTVRGPR